jgi:uroporphyrinogen decarboxylase
MTGIERLAAAMRGAPADRIPVFCNLLDQGARELGASPREYYSRGEHVAEAQLRMRERYGHDNVWSLFYVGKEAELLGCRHIIFADDGPPNVGHMIIRSPGDIHALRVPDDVSAHPAFAETKACLRLLRESVGGRFPICAYVTATMALPALLMGMEHWIELLLNGPAAQRDELLEKCHEFFVKHVRAYREGGADVIVYANPFMSTDFVPMRFVQATSLPWLERDIAGIGTDGVVFYCGGARMNPVIDTVFTHTGLGAYYLSPLEDVAEGRRAVGGRALCCGIINDIKLIDWSPDEVAAEVRRIIDAGKPGGRFLFGTLVMPLAIPDANIRALVDTACQHGRLT